MINSDKLATLLTAYIDGELDEEQMKEIRKLLESDAALYKSYEAEKQLCETMSKKLPTVKAPDYLRQRIRRDIMRGPEKPTFWQLIHSMFEYRPLATSLAVAAMVVIISLPAYQIVGTGFGPPVSAMKQGFLDGEIICLDCDVFSDGTTNKGHDPELHRPGLRCSNGAIWTILPANGAERILYGRDLLKKKARLVGLIFNDSRYIRVSDFQLL